jgi:hypothetical protein
MELIAGQGLSRKPQAFLETGHRGLSTVSRRSWANYLNQSSQNQGLQGRAPLGGDDFGPAQDVVGQINGRFHKQ